MDEGRISADGEPGGADIFPAVVAEISGNHAGSFDKACQLISAANTAGANAVKIQTYSADTLTLDCDKPSFRVGGLWRGETLYSLYQKAATPFDWHQGLFEHARRTGIPIFSSPFDATAVDLLESLDAPFYKIASCELVDIGLIGRVAATGKPMILSTGMASAGEIEEALAAVRRERHGPVCLLHCVSGYPTAAHDLNLRRMLDMRDRFGVAVGLSDHSVGTGAAVAATAMGAAVIEKHFCLSRDDEGAVDAAFSLEPSELKKLVTDCRQTREMLGEVSYGPTAAELETVRFRRSLHATADIQKGAVFTDANVRSIRPAGGLHTRYLPRLLGERAACDIAFGDALDPSMIAGGLDEG